MTQNKKKKQSLTQTLKNYELCELDPINSGQHKIEESFDNNILTLVHGYPGTGKTMYSLWLMLSEMHESKLYDKIIIIRSSVSSREIGYLPGKEDEKMQAYEAPYENIVDNLYSRGNAYKELKSKGMIEFHSSSFLRGLTLENCLVIVDEFQNLNTQELHTIVTRIGDNCKMVICGDTGQDDLTSERYNERSGAKGFMDIIKKIKTVGFINMKIEDIVRSAFVKEYIIEMYS